MKSQELVASLVLAILAVAAFGATGVHGLPSAKAQKESEHVDTGPEIEEPIGQLHNYNLKVEEKSLTPAEQYQHIKDCVARCVESEASHPIYRSDCIRRTCDIY